MLPYVTAGVAFILFVFSCCGAFAPLITGEEFSASYWRASPDKGDGYALFDSEKSPFCLEAVTDADCDGSSGGSSGSSSRCAKVKQRCFQKCNGPCYSKCLRDDNCLSNGRRLLSSNNRKLLSSSAKDICKARKAACSKLKAAAAFGVMTWLMSVPALGVAILPAIGKPVIPLGFVLPAVMSFFSLISWAVLISTKWWTDKDGDLKPFVSPEEDASMGAAFPMELLTWFLCFALAGLLFLLKNQNTGSKDTGMEPKV